MVAPPFFCENRWVFYVFGPKMGKKGTEGTCFLGGYFFGIFWSPCSRFFVNYSRFNESLNLTSILAVPWVFVKSGVHCIFFQIVAEIHIYRLLLNGGLAKAKLFYDVFIVNKESDNDKFKW